jgi:adenylate cyclase class 1
VRPSVHLLPWLLSINHGACPGYIPDLGIPSRYSTLTLKIRHARQSSSDFGIQVQIPASDRIVFITIQGLYTIGSVGSVSRTSVSDRDIWVCYNKEEFTETSWRQPIRKSIHKDWMI